MSIPPDCADQIAAAYREMAEQARYRPCAPSDGFGNLAIPPDELDLDAETAEYIEGWWAEEDDDRFLIGCPDFTTRPAMIYAIEAARLCCGGPESRAAARRLLEMAVEELR